ncbi:MAG: hypothetical protein ACK5LC_09455 [Coprobacillaceae bacterium]
MMIFKTIYGLFKGTRYGVLGLSLLGIIGSIILLCMNITLGVASTSIFLASLIGSAGLLLLLLPELIVHKLMKLEMIMDRRYLIGAVLLVVAFTIVGLIYVSTGGFPTLNIPFTNI